MEDILHPVAPSSYCANALSSCLAQWVAYGPHWHQLRYLYSSRPILSIGHLLFPLRLSHHAQSDRHLCARLYALHPFLFLFRSCNDGNFRARPFRNIAISYHPHRLYRWHIHEASKPHASMAHSPIGNYHLRSNAHQCCQDMARCAMDKRSPLLASEIAIANHHPAINDNSRRLFPAIRILG